jgi:hypothetical protein
VRRAGVIRDDECRAREHRFQFGEAGAACKIGYFRAHLGSDRGGRVTVTRRADDDGLKIILLAQSVGSRGEALGEPALGAAVGRAGVERHHAPAEIDPRRFEKLPGARAAFFVGAQCGLGFEIDGRATRELLFELRRDVEVVAHLVPSLEVRFKGNRPRQQRAAGVCSIAYNFFSAAGAGRERRAEGVRQQHGKVEMLAAQSAGVAEKTASRPERAARLVHRDQLIGQTFAFK